MILLLSGEGPGDLGSCAGVADECEGGDFRVGPMALIIDQLVEPIWGYSPLGASAFIYVSERVVALRSRRLGHIALPGLKRPKDTGYFFKNARALAQMANTRTTPQTPVGAVLFRDCDGTRSAGTSLWQEKRGSIIRGFEAETFSLGVPMLPKPKSEVWLLCAVQRNPYTRCERFEHISGNDASPNSAKSQLDDALVVMGKQYADICDMIRDGTIRAAQIAMPSYDRFRERLEQVAREMAGKTGRVKRQCSRGNACRSTAAWHSCTHGFSHSQQRRPRRD